MTAADAAETPWQRLSIRVVWVDVVVSLLSLLPGAAALWIFDAEPSGGALWPLLFVAVAGTAGAVSDILRWAFTTYRVTPTDIELRTGVLVRRHRTLHRDRVRSVDTATKLRHRLTGLRVVTIGAGQQAGAGESALVLDALSATDAVALREGLLRSGQAASPDAAPAAAASSTAASSSAGPRNGVQVLATFRPGWVLYNMFSIWSYVMAAGLLWGGFWFVSAFGVDAAGVIAGLTNWDAVGWPGITLLVLAGTGILGALGLGVNFLLGYGRFELSRVRQGDHSHLRTRRGLLSTREVLRDESRMRGLSISEPVLWRWIGMADTNVITTGLNVWDPEEPTAILPRGPVTVARGVAGKVFGRQNPFDAPLAAHPLPALRRRLWWATAVSAVAPAVLLTPALTGAVPAWSPWAAAAVRPPALLAAVVAYRSLGHTIDGSYLVVRSGLFSRTTSALRRDAVSTIAVRQSVLQRRLGLATVSAMTAAGWSAYEIPDVPANRAVELASEAAPGVLDDFIERPSPVARP
ncbi:PH domain-containing protein [Arthrobacter sp. ATA002]|uniref:PH domain-containing protein n=1 Tax=Arthrobacter sp. ATA002 TaxID=2991715 RepID=UPI0022A7FFD2|nr:PH domain-containing protein [Arthrobacter sp. ATA002]WAP50589.1 PH domain-containing protein [Arthrobacter sp. ATA002]